MVTIALANSVEWFVAFAACWKIGAIPQPVSAKLPRRELQAILELADPSLVIGVPPELAGSRRTLPAGYRPDPHLADDPLPDVTSPAWKAPTSGGSTGRPKLIVSGDPALYDEDAPPLFGQADGCMVIPAPLYHNGPHRVVLLSLVGRKSRRRPSPFRRRGHPAGDRPASRRHRVPRAHDDEADLAAARRRPRLLRPVVAAARLAPGGALSPVAEAGLDRLAWARADSRALRGHRGTGGHRDHREPNGSPTAVPSAGPPRAR